MAAQQPIYRFEPSLCVFVGELGDAVLRDFQAFRDLVPPPLRDGVGLISVRTDLATVHSVDFDGSNIGSGDIETIVQERTNAITAAYRITARRAHNYDNWRVQPTIYIIGSHDDSLVGETLKAMDALEREGVLLPIIYLIETDEIQPVLGNGLPTAPLSNCHAPDVAIFFQNQAALLQLNQQPQLEGYVGPAQRSYSIAEALFAFCTAGITESSVLQDLFAQGANRRTMAKVGTVTGLPPFTCAAAGTSMMLFPRQAFLSYDTHRKIGPSFCSEENFPTPTIRYDGDDLEDEVTELTKFVRETITGTSKAYRLVPSVRQRRQGVVFLRPEFGPLLADDYAGDPHEDVASRLKDALERRDDHERRLFAALSYREVSSNTSRQITFASATLLANGNAQPLLRQWEAERRILWDAVATLLRLRVVSAIEQSWQQGPSGVRKAERMAYTLLDRFDQANADLGKLRAEDRKRYEKELAHFEHLVRRTPPGISVILPADSGVDEGPESVMVIEAKGVKRDPGDQSGLEVNAQGRFMPPREESIARRFAFAVDLAYGQIPPIQMLVAVALVAFVPLDVMLTAVIPPVGPYAGSWAKFIAIALASALILGAAVYHVFRRLSWIRLKHRMLEFHRVFYARRLEEFEHLQRAATIGNLRSRVRRAHDRLESFTAFRDELCGEANRRRVEANHQLFHSPAAVRDIFFANGNLLSEDASYTLETFSAQVDVEIEAASYRWLNDQREVFVRFLEYVHKVNEYLIDAEFDVIFRLAWEFLAPKIGAHLQPQHADAHHLLRADLQRASPQVLPQLDALATVLADNPLLPIVSQYIAAAIADYDLIDQHGQWASDDVWVPTQSSNWFAKLRFATLSGNLVLPAESVAKLFPPF